MEHLDIFYRVFHEDLNPLTNQKTKGYYYTNIQQLITNEDEKNIEINGSDLASVKFRFYKLLLVDAQKKIKRELHEKVFLYHLEKEQIQTLVQNSQALLLNYCQIIESSYFSEEDELSKFHLSPDNTDIDIFKQVYQTMDNLLEYLEQLFYEYLDHTHPVSHQQKLWFIYRNKKLTEIIIKQIDKIEIPEEAKKIINAPLLQIRDNMIASLTYQNRSYLLVYIKVLKNLLKKEPNPSIEILYKVLISLEFNTFKIFFFLVNHFKEKTQNLDAAQRLAKLYSYQKDMLTISITSSSKYNPNLPSLKEQLLIWVREEINYLQHKDELSLLSDEELGLLASQGKKKSIDISVSELSLITRLLIETDKLKGSKKPLFQFLSETFTTKKATAISAESLRNKYYSVTETTKNSVAEMLKGMLYRLENMQGEG